MNQSLIFKLLVTSDKNFMESEILLLDQSSQNIIKLLRKTIDSKLINFPGAFRAALDPDESKLLAY